MRRFIGILLVSSAFGGAAGFVLGWDEFCRDFADCASDVPGVVLLSALPGAVVGVCVGMGAIVTGWFPPGIRRAARTGCALIVGLFVIAAWLAEPVTKDEAQRSATEEMHRVMGELGRDPSRLDGPESIEIGGVPYGFRWSYGKAIGNRVELIVSVDEGGVAEIGFFGDYERLPRGGHGGRDERAHTSP